MPQYQNRSGWEPPTNLRIGQLEAYELARDPNRRELNCEWPTGYGKTVGICIAYAARASMGLIDKLLIIVPGTERKDSYLYEIEQDFREKVDFPVEGAADALSEFAGRYLAEVYVVNNESIPTNQDYLKRLLTSKGRWMIAIDEYHHLRVGSVWGTAVSALVEHADFVLSVTATPQRTDKESTISGMTIHSKVSYSKALEEDAIRPIRVHALDYEVDISFDDGSDEKEVERIKLSEYESRLKEIKEEKAKTMTDAEFRGKVRHHSKYVQRLLLEAFSCWQYKEMMNPGQHQMIVYAADCSHAQELSRIFNDLAGERIADWVGSGPNGRSEKTNRQILDRFLGRGDFASTDAPSLKCLVQVTKASEGFNCIRASVAVFLNMMGLSVQAEQAIGRVTRRNYKIDPCHPGYYSSVDHADIFLSIDSPLLPLLRSLELPSLSDEDKSERSGEGRESQLMLFSIPDFYIIDANWLSTEQFWVGRDGQKVSVETALSKARLHPAAENKTDEELIQYLSQVFGSEPKQLSTEERRRQAKNELNEAVGTLASSVVKVRSNSTFAKSLVGDTKKAIAQHLKRKYGGGRDSLTVLEIKSQYDYIQEINNKIRAQKTLKQKLEAIPTWLMI